MTEYISIAKQLLLQPTGLGTSDLSRVIDRAMVGNIDYADLYFQYSRSESWSLEESTIKSGSYDIGQGVGIRSVSGGKTGFAYSDEIELVSLQQAANAARSIAVHGQKHKEGISLKNSAEKIRRLYPENDPLGVLTNAEKIALIRQVEQVARGLDNKVSEVMVNLAGGQTVVLIASSEGYLVADVRPMVRMNVTVIVEHNGRREQGHSGGGGRYDYLYFQKENLAQTYAEEAVRQALVNLESKAAPAGEMNVVLGPGWPGILLHEAIGHGLEGDFNRKGTSAFSNMIGQKVASEDCTVVDDGTLANRRGSLSVDDEGVTTQNTVLIENGILKGYMQDKTNGRLMGMASTGNGRRESYAHLPMPRMTNTYMYNGQYDPEEVIRSVDHGLYAVNFGGGQVDITSGKFVFSASEAYMIEKGKITYPVKGATLIGNGPEVLTRISMVGNDLALDAGVGVCGKEGQSVPVGVGQPTIRINGLTVGGVSV